MKILAIDTSSRRRCVCVVVTDAGVIERGDVTTEENVDRALSAMIVRALEHSIDAVVVATGPGSYTGVRVGMAAALGVTHSLSIPLHGVGSLDVIARAAPPELDEFWVHTDASRGAAYVARYAIEHDGIIGSQPSRVMVADFEPDAPVVTCDAVGAPSPWMIVDPVIALGRAAPVACTGPELTWDRVGAAYVLGLVRPAKTPL